MRLILFSLVIFAGQTVAASEASVERGRYLAEEVAQCQACHTPQNETGEYDRTRWMKGATLNFAPIKPVEGWHKSAPDLTPGSRLWNVWKEEGLVKYMQTGLTPRGKKADPPMPAYKLSKEDAQAVIDYLKSLETK
ncbi:MAG: c-type cytochrome [Bryobacteraceae bacterium]|nr:c-type cytochrome [Bryobacteraceae bacterium]